MKRAIPFILACTAAVNAFAADYATASTDDRFAQIENRHLAKRGYRAFVTIDEGATIMAEDIDLAPYIGVTTTHGYQINHYLFAGAGFGVNLALHPNHTLVRVPVFVEVRTNVGKRVAQFTAGLRAGASFAVPEPLNPNTDKTTQFYSQIDFGLRLGFSQKFAMHITPYIAYSNYKRGNDFDNDYYYSSGYEDSNLEQTFRSIYLADIGLRVAFEF